jgi:hypothetical protein
MESASSASKTPLLNQPVPHDPLEMLGREMVGWGLRTRFTKGNTTMKRPQLDRMPLAGVLASLRTPKAGQCLMTMSVEQWDTMLQVAYDGGWTLLELDRKERPLAAYKRLNP